MALNRIPPVSLAIARTTLDDLLKSSTPEHPLPDDLRAIVRRELDTIHNKPPAGRGLLDTTPDAAAFIERDTDLRTPW